MVIEHNARPRVRQYLLVSRILFFVGIGLTVAGGVLKGSDSSSDAITGVKIVKAGYFIAVAFVVCLLAVQRHLCRVISGRNCPVFCIQVKRYIKGLYT